MAGNAPKHHFECKVCSRTYPPSQHHTCSHCESPLSIAYDYDTLEEGFRSTISNSGPLSVWRYAQLLPVRRKDAVTIGEGGTGLSKSGRVSVDLEQPELFFKFEGQNPTGSFKDRGMTVAITRALEVGTRSVICASTGNTSASMAAYAAKAGFNAIVLIPKGKIAKGKLIQAIVHGAKIVEVNGNFDAALERARNMTGTQGGMYLANSINPYRVEGQKTIAFEIYEQLGRVPDYVFLPVGNAGNICAIWKGFKELNSLGVAENTPRIVGVQASGAAPIAAAFSKGSDEVAFWNDPETCASAIRIGAPARWRDALAAAHESGGAIISASDMEILRARRMMAEREGVFAEPASAAPLAGLVKYKKIHRLRENVIVVCIVTGHGLKDPSSVLK